MSLSDRIRPNSEAAQWVVDEVKQLESELFASQAREKELREKLEAAEALNSLQAQSIGMLSKELEAVEAIIKASQEQEPVAYWYEYETDLNGDKQGNWPYEPVTHEVFVRNNPAPIISTPLYAQPPIPPELAELQCENAELRKLLKERKVPEWTCAMDELPAICQRVILCINGVVQHEIYIMDAADKSDFHTEYFWSRPELEEGLEISPNQFWMPLPQPKEPKQ